MLSSLSVEGDKGTLDMTHIGTAQDIHVYCRSAPAGAVQFLHYNKIFLTQSLPMQRAKALVSGPQAAMSAHSGQPLSSFI